MSHHSLLRLFFSLSLLSAAAGRAQSYNVLHSFTGESDGSEPIGSLTMDAQSNIYGTTLNGGAFGLGVVFKLDSSGNETVIHSFAGGTDGANVPVGVVRDTVGPLYGGTQSGGTFSEGTLFKIDPSGNETVLHDFAGGSDGISVASALTLDPADNLYGITYYGGSHGAGTIFQATTAGSETVLYSFKGGTDGNPDTALVRDAAGNLYGAARGGGGPGEVFELTSGGNEIVLHVFGGPDGNDPRGDLIQGSNNLYGTTFRGGASNAGVVFKLDASGNETVLYSFTGGTDGANPQSGLVRDAAGNLYGTTYNGGSNGFGVVFKLDPLGNETVLHAFSGIDGANPYGSMFLSASGILYGTTHGGGAPGHGTVFSLILAGAAPAAPAVTLTPSYLVFPAAGDTLQVTVTNSGNGNLNITTTPTTIGSNANDFKVAGSGTTCVGGATISPGNSCIVEVAFAPSTESWEVATLPLFDNASYGPQTVPLSGGGQLISISPNPVPGSASAQTVTITGTNFTDGATINWQDLTTPPWTGTVTPQSISPDSITASMNFTDANAIWQIAVVNPGQAKTSPDRTSNWYTFQVLGTGSAAPSLLDDYPFKNAPVDTRDPYDFASDECTSYVAWRINRDNGTTDPSNPSFFNKMAGEKWGSALTWGMNAGLLKYGADSKPQVGDIAQWTKINHVAYVERVNNPDGSIDVSEYNYGSDNGGIKYEYGARNVPPKSFPDEFIHISRLSLSPTSLDFGTVGIGTPSSQEVVITNSLAQTISPAVTVGASEASTVTNNFADTGDFTETDTCSGTSLLPDAQCGITVTFAPPNTLTKGGARSAAIILNWGSGPQLIPVNGIALTDLKVSPKALSFGKVPVGQRSAAKTVKLTNNTGTDVTISSISPGPEFKATGCSAPLANGSSCTVSITFSPTTRGQQSATLTITDTAVNSPQTVSLKGTGT